MVRVRTRKLIQTGRARAIRQAAGVSQDLIARRVGVTPSAVNRWELGRREPRPDLARRYLRALEELERALAEVNHDGP